MNTIDTKISGVELTFEPVVDEPQPSISKEDTKRVLDDLKFRYSKLNDLKGFEKNGAKPNNIDDLKTSLITAILDLEALLEELKNE